MNKPLAQRTQTDTDELNEVFKYATGQSLLSSEVNDVKLHYTVDGETVHTPVVTSAVLYKNSTNFILGGFSGGKNYLKVAGENLDIKDLVFDDITNIRITYKDSDGMHSIRPFKERRLKK